MMAIKSTQIDVLSNVEGKVTSEWTDAKSNTGRKTITDRKTPKVSDSKASVSKPGGVTLDGNISSKVDNKSVSKITNGLKTDLNITGMDIDSNMIDFTKANMISNITAKLTSPGLPLNIKNMLGTAVNIVCGTSSTNQLSMNMDLKLSLDSFGLDELLKMTACLSDPIKLAQTTISLLSGVLPDTQVTSGLNTMLSTGKVGFGTAAQLTSNSKGINIIKSDKNILGKLDKHVDSKGMDNVSSTNLYNDLPKDDDSMSVYASNDDGLFSNILRKQTNTKPKQELTSTPGEVDENSKHTIFMASYKTDKTKPTL